MKHDSAVLNLFLERGGGVKRNNVQTTNLLISVPNPSLPVAGSHVNPNPPEHWQ